MQRTVAVKIERSIFLLVLALGCAPLSASTMTERCRDIYDACLDGCRPPPGPPGVRPGETNTIAPPHDRDWQIDVASCTNSCNESAKTCR
jgi:hypothetical protein